MKRARAIAFHFLFFEIWPIIFKIPKKGGKIERGIVQFVINIFINTTSIHNIVQYYVLFNIMSILIIMLFTIIRIYNKNICLIPIFWVKYPLTLIFWKYLKITLILHMWYSYLYFFYIYNNTLARVCLLWWGIKHGEVGWY